jgi:hypothetical protein
MFSPPGTNLSLETEKEGGRKITFTTNCDVLGMRMIGCHRPKSVALRLTRYVRSSSMLEYGAIAVANLEFSKLD